MTARLIGTDAPEWAALLAAVPHDVWVLPAYVAVCAARSRGQAAAVYAEDDRYGRVLVPIVIRECGNGRRDAISPYGYPGIVVDGHEGEQVVATAMHDVVEALRSDGMVSLFLRMHPLFPVAGLEAVGTVVRTETVAIDLTQDEEQIWQGMRKSHRRQVTRGLRDLDLEFSVDDTDGAHAAFRELYGATMRRVGATEFYHFDDEYFDRLRSALGDHLHLATVCQGDKIVAAGLLTESAGIVTAYLTGHDECVRCRELVKVLKYSSFVWAKSRGNRWYHLGGGRGGESDSLLHFKTGFSPLRLPYETVRVVLRDKDYRDLVAQRQPEIDAADASGYFPRYRDPMSDTSGCEGSGV